LLGRNGAGKSTCMNVTVGLLPPRAGAVEVFGRPVTRFAPEQIAARGVALVPQGRRVFKSLTVRENLAVAARKPDAGSRHAPWTTETVFAMFPRLAERRDQRGGTLSGGEQQMLAIGRALMSRPRLLLLDEPSLGLAPLIVRQIFEAIGRIAREEGVTIFLVEQNAFHALRLADRGYVLANGRVRLSGTGRELLANAEVRAAYLEGGHA
jgi:branched-chain amino acid transport system ATP-binding protein